MRKRFGQHFLVDDYVIDRIVNAIAPVAGQTIFEIGPGSGVLTTPLLNHGVQLNAIEIDRDLAATLEETLGQSEHFKLFVGDVLKFDFEQHLPQQPGVKVVGNLPYNISTPLILRLLQVVTRLESMTFMVQQEVAERLAADVGGKQYGRLSVMAQRHTEIQLLFGVAPECFDPPPKVESAVVRMTPRTHQPDRELDSRFEEIVRQAFGQRRKTLANALGGMVSSQEIESCGIDPRVRAETLTVDAFERLAAKMPQR